jgi:signal transduction histidine kinase
VAREAHTQKDAGTIEPDICPSSFWERYGLALITLLAGIAMTLCVSRAMRPVPTGRDVDVAMAGCQVPFSVLGFVASVLTSGLVLSASQTRERAMRIAQRITHDLRQAEQKYRDIFENCADGIFQRSSDGRLLSANAAMAYLFGFSTQAELLDTCDRLGWEKKASPQSPAAPVAPSIGVSMLTGARLCIALLDGTLDDGQEFVARRSDGTEAWLRVRVSPVHSDDGSVVYQGIVCDVTQARKAMLEAGQRARAEADRNKLRDSLGAMETVLGVVSHELRTPLAAVRAMAEVMISPETRESVDHDRYTRQILQQTVQLVGIVGNLLDAARFNSGAVKWHWDTVQLNDVCTDAADTIRPLVDANTSLALDIEPDLTLQGDSNAIRRLIVNLLSNACKFTKQGSVTLECRRASDREQLIEVRVRDTGGGIPKHLQERLGEAFVVSSDAVAGRRVEGSGLGLTLCKSIAAAHGGRMWIESEEGVGTTVTAHLRRDLTQPAAEVRIELTRKAAVAA